MSFFQNTYRRITNYFSGGIVDDVDYHQLATSEQEERRDIESRMRSVFFPPFLKRYNFLNESNIPTNIFGDKFQRLLQRAHEVRSNGMKMIIVYLHSPEHQDTEEFLKTTFTSPEFKEFLKKQKLERVESEGEEENEEIPHDINDAFLFHISDIQTREGYQLSVSLRATRFPFFAILLNEGSSRRSNRDLNLRKVTALGKVEGFDGKEEFLRLINGLYERSLPQFVSREQVRIGNVQTRSTRNIQDEEYERVLRQDQLAEQERVNEEERERQRLSDLEANRGIGGRIWELVKKKKEEIDNNEDLDKSMVYKVRFKFPDGSNLEWSFLKTEKVKVLYYFVHSLGYVENARWKPAEESTMKHLLLVLNFPKRELLEFGKTLEELKLRSETIYVNELEEYDDDQNFDELMNFEE